MENCHIVADARRRLAEIRERGGKPCKGDVELFMIENWPDLIPELSRDAVREVCKRELLYDFI